MDWKRLIQAKHFKISSKKALVEKNNNLTTLNTPEEAIGLKQENKYFQHHRIIIEHFTKPNYSVHETGRK